MAATGIVGAVGAITASIYDMGKTVAPTVDIDNAFNQLATSIGEDSRTIVARLTEATAGMVDDEDLMNTFRQSVNLLGRDLSDQLPSALALVAKQAIATGQDVGASSDTFVEAIGRLRPMALAQMGITVDLQQVFKDYAATLGVTADQLTDTQKRTALFNAVMAQLQENTAGLPDAAQSAQAPFKEFDVTMGNLTESIQGLFLPAASEMARRMNRMAGIAKDFADNIGEKGLSQAIRGLFDAAGDDAPFEGLLNSLGIADEIARPLSDTIGAVVDRVLAFTDALGAGVPFMDAFTTFLNDLASQGVIAQNVADALTNIGNTITAITAPITDWINQNVQLQDVLTALAIVITAAVAPAIVGVVVAALPIIALFAGLVVAIALLRTAWESDFLGIREIAASVASAVGGFIQTQLVPAIQNVVTWLQTNLPIAIAAASNFWQTSLLPALQQVGAFITGTVVPAIQNVVTWLQTNIPVAVQAAAGFWTNTLQPALQQVGDFITNTVVPAVQSIVTWLQTNIPVAVQAASDFWNNTLYPALQQVWNFIQNSVIPVFDSLANLAIAGVNLVLTALGALWNDLILPALTDVWNFIQKNVVPIFNQLGDTIRTLTGGPLALLQTILDTISGVFAQIKSAIDSVTSGIASFTASLSSIQLPSFLTPGSPTPFELGLQGILDTMNSLSGQGLPQFNANLAGAGAAAGEGGASNTTNIGSFQVVFNGSAPATPIEGDHSADMIVQALRNKGVQI